MFNKVELSQQDTLDFFGGDELASDVFLKKYAVTRPDGTIEEYLPTQMWKRMAKAAAAVEDDKEKWEEKFLEVLTDWKAVPQGSIMFALGNPHQKSSMSNCFVLPVQDDSLESIFQCAKEMAQTYAYRGGVGIDISPLRPEGAVVSNAARTSTGAWSFMDFYSYVTRLIGQHGRRGALMLTIADSHPDLLRFITAKKDKTKVTGANISVRISDAFMNAVETDSEWEMKFTTKHETISHKMPAREIWDTLIETTTTTAEPGIIFWDTVLRESPADCYGDVGFTTQTTNPCGEVPLAYYDACTLLSQNLTLYTRNNFTRNAYFDFDGLANDVTIAVRFLDNVKELDLKLMPLKKQREVAAKGRRIGMGSHGLADTLANLCIKYDSDRGIEFIDKLYEFYAKTVYKASVELAAEKGTFPIFDVDKEKNNPFLNRIGFAGVPRRNIACLTCAPTGTVSCLCQTSSGLEPVFRNFYTRRRKITHNEAISIPKDKLFVDKTGDLWQEYKVAHHNVQKYMKQKDIQKFEDVELPNYFVESQNIDWTKRVKIQATIQKWTDHSISSTANLPARTSKETVKQIYMEAFRQKCFPSGHSIATPNGLKDISEIKKGDEVFGLDGKAHTVTEHQSRYTNEELITIKASGLESVCCTAEHPIAVIEQKKKYTKNENGSKHSYWEKNYKNFVWKMAKDIEIGDHVVCPKQLFSKNFISQIEVKDYLDQYIIDNELVYKSRSLPWKKEIKTKSPASYGVKNVIEIGHDFMYLLGWYIAEGHTQNSYVRFSLNVNERPIAEKLVLIIERLFGVSSSIEVITNGENGKNQSLRIQCGSTVLRDFFDNLCGKYAENKHLPKWFANLQPQFLKTLVDNYHQGDTGVTISPTLSRELFIAYLLIGAIPQYVPNYGEGFHVKQCATTRCVGKPFEEFRCYRVRKIEKSNYSGKVYNFGVSDVESYLVNGIIVHNCKGFTIYVDGCRDGVLITEDSKSSIKKTDAPKRPYTLDADVYHITVKGQLYFVIVGLMDKDPYEVFAGQNGFIDRKVKSAKVTKIKRGFYKAEFNDGTVIENIGEYITDEQAAITRLISLSLRHGADIKHCVAVLERVPGDMHNFGRSMARALKNYIPDNTVITGSSCPSCGGENLKREMGCVVCVDCAWSGCS